MFSRVTKFGTKLTLSNITSKRVVGASPLLTSISNTRDYTAEAIDVKHGLTEDQQDFYDLALKFAKDKMEPDAAKWDAEETMPVDVLRQAAEIGFGAIYTPEPYGTGMGRVDAAVIYEALAQGCTSTTAYITIHNMATWMIATFGNEEQAERFLPDLASMQTLASYCLTEPNAGSDASSLQTSARKEGNDYILNGSKAFISNAGLSDVYVVMARTGDPGPKGITAFILEKGMEGLNFGAKEKKLGWNSQPTRALYFEDLRVPEANRLGQEGEGFKFAMKGLDGGRINIGACSVGAAQACLESALDYVTVREQFGKPIAAFQNTQFKLADMASQLQSARLMIRSAAQMLDEGNPNATVHAAMAKRLATDVGFNVCNDALQLFGGYGYLKDYPIERYLRDARVHQILEGTNEVMRLIISREMMKGM